LRAARGPGYFALGNGNSLRSDINFRREKYPGPLTTDRSDIAKKKPTFGRYFQSRIERVWVCFSAGKKMSERSELFFPEEKHSHGLSAPSTGRPGDKN